MDSFASSLNPNKRLKEEFVSNLSGSSMLEIAAISTTIPMLVLLRRSLRSFKVIGHVSKDAFPKKNDDVVNYFKSWRAYMIEIAVDFLVFVFPTLLFITVLAEWTYIWPILLTMPLVIFTTAKRFCSFSPSLEGSSLTLRESITSYRVVMMIMTCLCILAVDFKLFPRKYAKTETYGTSLMDLGVGSFVVANSLVSRQTRKVSLKLKNLLLVNFVLIFWYMKWEAVLKSTSPLIVLGLVRLITTSGVDYQVHVGEYGTHWNFFFTLAAVSILTSIINIPLRYSGIVGFLIVVGYQTCLIKGLNVYLLSNERGADIFGQNKEGLFSIFGYWSMYLIGVQLGSSLFFGKHSSTLPSKRRGTILVWIFSLFLWLLTVLLDFYVEKVSRRMCNLAYVTLVLAQNLQVLGILMLSDYIPGSKPLAIERAFNSNLLPAFLLANALTGLVNLSVDTLSASPVSSLFILLAYAFTLSAVIGLADFHSIRLKFWGVQRSLKILSLQVGREGGQSLLE